MSDSTTYTVSVTHFADGEIIVSVNDIGDAENDRKCAADALRKAASQLEDMTYSSINKERFS